MSDPSELAPELAPEPDNLRFLRMMVITLMVVMIGGFLVIVALFVIRFSSTGPALPDTITLPDGTRAEAITFGRSWYAVVTGDDTILIFDRLTGALRQTITLDQARP